jgi:Fe-S-cluster-containing dehydrogenase component/anaerobic selenocysteine-containing dehydrogenase
MSQTNFQEEKKSHWQSFETKDKSDIKAVQNQEFYTSPDPVINRIKTGEYDRKTFLQLMGASSAMLTLNCLQKPVEKIVPFVKSPDYLKPGQATYYSSTCSGCSAGCGVLVKTKDARPLKLEGNPTNPISKGALCAVGQSSILNLYDPDRSKEPAEIKAGAESTIKWADLDTAVKSKLVGNKGGVRILTTPIDSPSTKSVIAEFLKVVGGGKHYEYDTDSAEESIAIAAEKSYGKAIVPSYKFDKAKVIVSIDADFLGTWISPVEFGKQFASRRKIKDVTSKINTFYAIETVPTVTGTNADKRVAIKSGDATRFATGLVLALAKSGVGSASLANGETLEKIASEIGVDIKLFDKIASDLKSAKGESLVVAGGVSSQTTDAVDLQILVNAINSSLDNDGKTIDATNYRSDSAGSYTKNLLELKKEIDNKDVSVLFIYGANPAYSFPSLKLHESFSKVKLVVSLSDRVDETSTFASFIAPTHSGMETWGDREAIKGVISIQQPTIRPLYNTRSLEDSLIQWAGGKLFDSVSYYEYLKNSYTKKLGSQFAWEEFLRNGTLYKESDLSSNKAARSFKGSVAKLSARASGNTLALYTTVGLGNGSNANNATLQELPDPVAKTTWDNFLGISPSLAEKEGIKSNDVITVKVGDKTLTLPAQIQPGLQKETLSIAVGYGRTKVGKVGNGVGKNSFELASLVNNQLVFAGLPISLEKTGKTYKIATTQDHHMMNPAATPGQAMKGGLYSSYEKDRPLIQSVAYEDFIKNPAAGKAPSEIPVIQKNGKDVDSKGFNPDYEYKGYRWGMSIDLSLCTGCSACVTACQIENNIPVVGRDEVRVGREMHWIRIDRYYIGDPTKPETMEIAHQPVMCQHCENAPCETVCPVAATVHGSEGTNDMIYNRCVGTRYCSNNCPYKVRRFNWMLHWKDKDFAREPRHLAFNPDVTVRTRGVMEKCTFCSSRIAEKKIKAKNENRTLKDGELKTACQETCPADAITFGNTNDKEATVTKNRDDKRAYKILDFLNVLPQVSYLTRVRNKTNV